jgi:hypothetical protein
LPLPVGLCRVMVERIHVPERLYLISNVLMVTKNFPDNVVSMSEYVICVNKENIKENNNNKLK